MVERYEVPTRVIFHVSGIAVIDLAYGVDPGASGEGRPKVFPDVLDGVDTKAIDTIFLDQRLDPSGERPGDRRVFRIDVRQGNAFVTQPTLFDVRLVVVIGDQAIGMKVA